MTHPVTFPHKKSCCVVQLLVSKTKCHVYFLLHRWKRQSAKEDVYKMDKSASHEGRNKCTAVTPFFFYLFPLHSNVKFSIPACHSRPKNLISMHVNNSWTLCAQVFFCHWNSQWSIFPSVKIIRKVLAAITITTSALGPDLLGLWC